MSDHLSALTRRQLYDLVWKKPVQAVAKEYGISDRGLGKLCERHGIPVPPRGYWARKEAGQKVRRPPLIEMEGSPRADDGLILAKVISKPRTNEEPSKVANDLIALWQQQLEETPVVRIAKTLSEPHTLVAQILERRVAEARRWSLSPSPYSSRSSGLSSLDRRSLRIIDALLKCFAGTSFKLEVEERTFDMMIHHLGRDSTKVSVYEHVRQFRRELPDEERAKSWSGTQKWTQVKEPTGKLVMKVDGGYFIPKKIPMVFHETDEEPLEGRLREVVASIVVALAHERIRREEREQEDRRRWEDQERARRIADERKAEEARKDALRADAVRWKEAAVLREYVAFVRAAAGAGQPAYVGGDLDAWVAWALAHADEIDPTKNKS